MDDKLSPAEAELTAIPAATLVVMRDRGDGPADLLLVKRAAHMRFAANAIVFPGGRIDPGDSQVAISDDVINPTDDPLCNAARVAAIRETLEESGLAIGFVAAPGVDWIAHARVELATGAALGPLLRAGGLRLDLGQLVPFARWRPNFRETRIFDTRFYLACAPADIGDPQVDDTENVHSYWDSASGVLRAADADDVFVIFPTRRNLERLALFDSFEAAHAHALRFPPQLITPFVEQRGDAAYLCIPDDCGYPVTAERFDRAKRAGS